MADDRIERLCGGQANLLTDDAGVLDRSLKICTRCVGLEAESKGRAVPTQNPIVQISRDVCRTKSRMPHVS